MTPGLVGVITLDTSAPVVAWGAVSGTSAGALLRVAYTLDEPELLDATVQLVDGRVLEAAVLADRLEVLLPGDVAGGPATVRARVRDDVGNEAIRELVVAIIGIPVITLDTTPPVVSWGAVGGTTAGELLQVAYTLDEPELLDATFVLLDGRQLPMTVHADRLELLLPVDASEGPATVRARVRDDVGNEAVRELVVLLTGVPYVPPVEVVQPPTPGWPAPARRARRPQHVVRGHSRLHTRSASRVQATRRARERVTAVGHVRVIAPRSGQTAVGVRSARALSREHVTSSTVRAVTRATVTRRDGPDDEALLLGLL